jgi:hypothetical protein
MQPVLAVIGAAALAVLFGAVEGRWPRQARGAPAPDEAPDAKPAEPVPFPDGVTDADRRTAFVSSPKGGVQAVRLEDGKVLWSNDDCTARPWLAAGRRLIALGERLAVLDIKNEGRLLRQCDTLAYPKVETPDRCTVAFHLWDPRVTGDTLEARWYAAAEIDRSKGRPFAFQAWTAFNKAAPAGTVKVNLETGRAEVHTDPTAADVTQGLVPEAAKPERRVPAGLPDKLADVWAQYHKDQNGRVAVVGGRLVGVALMVEPVGAEYQKRVVLNAWDLKTGAAAEPVELVKDKALAIANVMLTEDRRHAAVQFSTSALNVYSLTDGKCTAKEVKGVASPENAFVDGTRLFYVESGGAGGEQTLKAIDLEGGKAAWDRPLQPRSATPLAPP